MSRSIYYKGICLQCDYGFAGPHYETVRNHLKSHVHESHKGKSILWLDEKTFSKYKKKPHKKRVDVLLQKISYEEWIAWLKPNVKCSYCGQIIERLKLNNHMRDEHGQELIQEIKKLTELAERTRIVAEIREKKRDLSEELETLEKELKKEEIEELTEYSDIIDKVLNFLSEKGFDAKRHSQYLIARHRYYSDGIFIKLSEPHNYKQYDRMKSRILTLRRFKSKILKYLISKLEQSNIDTLQFGKGVITPFGWHAIKEVEERYRSLDDASEALGEGRILRCLRGMRNLWPKNRTHRIYSNIVNSDYDWFEKTHLKDSTYIRQKVGLIEELKTDCRTILPGASTSFRRLLRNIDDIKHWFVVIY